MRLLIIIPTYNEAPNIEKMVGTLLSLPWKSPFEILIVDDNSPDKTGELADKLSVRDARVNALHRPRKTGLGGAYIDGFKWGLARDFDWLIQMDADFSHNPKTMLAQEDKFLSGQYDCLAGCRFMPGGKIVGRNMVRDLLSWIGNIYARTVLSCPLRDLTGGFNAWSAGMLKKMNFSDFISSGYAFAIEIKYKAFKSGCRFLEFPIIFLDRRAGASKMSLGITLEALASVPRLWLKPDR